MTKLIRTLAVGARGSDVDGIKRTCYRGLDSLDSGKRLKKHAAQPKRVRELFGPFFRRDVIALEKQTVMPADGTVTPHQFKVWEAKGYPDSLAKALIDEYERAHTLQLCYPHPNLPGVYVGQGLHPTAGITGSWAIDFMAPGGTEVLASCDATVTRLSGHDPATGTHGAGDVYGWSLYLADAVGRSYYLTHLGSRTVKVGDRVVVGQKIGSVGHWPSDPGRSHSHIGVSSPLGVAEAKARITAISKAPRLPAL